MLTKQSRIYQAKN